MRKKMKKTAFENLQNDPRIKEAKKLLLDAVKDHQSTLKKTKKPHPELKKNSDKIITDSGGIQKEAYLNGIPCITIRSETEWTETVKAGWNVLVGDKKGQLIKNCLFFKPPVFKPEVFGDGNSAKKIISILKSNI